MRRFVPLLLGSILVVGGCSDEGDPQPAAPSPAATGSTSSPSPTPDPALMEPASYDAADCPVADEAFCATAIEVFEAVQNASPEGVLGLTREDRLPCAKLNVEYFPQCDGDEVLEGYGTSGPDFVVDVVDRVEFRQQLVDVLGNISPGISDELGGGFPRIVGVGTCGPDIPGRRTYHLAWTAGVAGERVLHSFEHTFADEEWKVALWYLGSYEDWEAVHGDTLDLAFCEAAFTPWPTA